MARVDFCWPSIDRGYTWAMTSIKLPLDTTGQDIAFVIKGADGETILELTEGSGITINETVASVSTRFSLAITNVQSAALELGVRHAVLEVIASSGAPVAWMSGPITVREA